MQALPSTTRRRALSATLVDELTRQNRALSTSARRDAHLAALSHHELGAVVTGQQVGLFLGPAYGLYKAATCIALARRLAARDGKPTVPIFWLQSEDHDAEEVCAAHVLDAYGSMASVVLAVEGQERASMAARALGAGVRDALRALGEHLQGAPHAADALEVLSRGYQPERGWVQAYAAVLGEVFAAEGLLVIDPRTAAIATLAAPVHRRALEHADEIDVAVQAGALESAAQPVLVRPRPGCSLSFHHADGPSGPRHRLERTADGWTGASSTVMDDAALVAELEREPLRFSTSSLLRVVLQDALLPTLAQIAGPGEARYLSQMPPLFAAYGMAPSPVVARARLVITDSACRRRLEALGIDASEVDDVDRLLRQLASRDVGVGGDEVSARLGQAFDHELARLTPELEAIAPALSRSISRTRAHVERGVARLAARVERARARRDKERVQRVEWLAQRLRPSGAPQERVLGFAHFAARFGIEPFKAAMFAAVDAHLDALARDEPDRLHEVAL